MKFGINLLRIVFLFLLLGNLAFSFFLLQKNESLENDIASASEDKFVSNEIVEVPINQAENASIDLSNYATKSYVDESISNIDFPEGKTETVTVVSESTSTQKQTAVLPISTSYSSQSLDWIDVPNTDFYLDLANDYSEDAIVTWEVFLHEKHGNGKAEARLYDVTNGIVVPNSELNVLSDTSTLLTSGNIAIWRGNNLYRVQIKSQKGFPVYFNSGRLKITY